MKRNLGIIDRLIRFVGIHFLISVKDTELINSDLLAIDIMCIGFYLVVTILFGYDPIYTVYGLDTNEKTEQNA